MGLAILSGAKSLLGGKKKKVAPEGPKVMPLADDEAVRRAKRASLAQQMARGGRSSTILSGDETETFGGGF